MSSEEIYNYVKASDGIATGGQPTDDQLRSVAEEGFTAVINLATTDRHSLEDEAGLVRSLGMDYFHIPVDWKNPQQSDFTEFERTMAELPAGKALIHCAANFRVTAFYSLYAQKHLGWSGSQAKEFRDAIWHGSHHPVWNRFVAQMEAHIASR